MTWINVAENPKPVPRPAPRPHIRAHVTAMTQSPPSTPLPPPQTQSEWTPHNKANALDVRRKRVEHEVQQQEQTRQKLEALKVGGAPRPCVPRCVAPVSQHGAPPHRR